MPLKPTHSQPTTHNLPVIPLRGIVPFPGMTLPLLVGRPSTLAALEEANQKDRMVLMVAQRDEEIEDPTSEDLYDNGTLAEVVQFIKLQIGRAHV